MKDFSRIAKPLHKLVRKDKKWSWGEEQEKAFKELKRVFCYEKPQKGVSCVFEHLIQNLKSYNEVKI